MLNRPELAQQFAEFEIPGTSVSVGILIPPAPPPPPTLAPGDEPRQDCRAAVAQREACDVNLHHAVLDQVGVGLAVADAFVQKEPAVRRNGIGVADGEVAPSATRETRLLAPRIRTLLHGDHVVVEERSLPLDAGHFTQLL